MMKREVGGQCQQVRLTEGMHLVFDKATPGSSGSLSRSSSSDSSYASSESSSSSYRSHHRRPRHRSSSSSSSSSTSSSRTRSRSHPRCHRASGRSRCRRRAKSRSFSPSPDCSSRSSYRTRSRSSSRSSRQRDLRRRSRSCSSRSSSSRSCSPHYRRGPRRFVGRYRCRFSPSPRRHYRDYRCRFSPSPRRRYRDYRSRSRSPEYSSVRLSHKEKMDLLNIAKENAAKLLGVRLVELPASVSSVQPKPDCTTEEGVREDRLRKRQAQDEGEDDEHTPQTSPTRRPITFSINNTVAKPSICASFQAAESKVTSRADSMGNRKPYGHWVPVNKTSPNKSRLPMLP